MPLDKRKLKNGIYQAFKKMQDASPPETSNSAQLEKHFADLLNDLSKDLSNTIDEYIRVADVVNIEASGTTDVTGEPETITVQVAQTNVGSIQ